MKRYSYLLFDLDGTLSNPFEGVAKGIQTAMQKLGAEIPEWDSLRTCIGPPLHHSFGRLLDAEPDSKLVKEALVHYREYYSAQGLYENELYPGVKELLLFLSKSYPLYLATSKPQPFAEHVLEHFELTDYFTAVYGSHLDGGRSDKIELIGELLKEQSLDPTQGVMIGDRFYDVEGGKENGLKTIGALWGFGSEAELLENGADFLCKHPANLVDLICE